MSKAREPRVDDDDDLDDLDDVLDQFTPQASAAPSGPGPSNSADETALLEKELEMEMESLFRNLGVPNPLAEDAGETQPNGGDSEEAAEWGRRFAAAVEAMDMHSMSASASTSTANETPGTKEDGDDFQSRIRSTMNKLKESESGLKASEPSLNAGGDTFEALLSQLQGLNGLSGEEGEQSEEQLQGMLEAMMGQLMNKDVLYDPLKELYEKFPGYIADHSDTISAEDKERFGAQISCIKRLLGEFEAKDYGDDNEPARERIVQLMSELQMHGSPPEEIMGPLPPGFSMGADGLPNMPDDCKMN